MRHSDPLDSVVGSNHWRTTNTRPGLITPEDELEFMRAMADYRSTSGRMFPTWSEILEVIRSLGYEKRIWMPVAPDYDVALAAADDVPEPVQGWFSQVEFMSTL